MSRINSFVSWFTNAEGDQYVVEKVKTLKNKNSVIFNGESFRGTVKLCHSDHGVQIVVLEHRMNTSLLVDAKQKDADSWLVKTLNSVYRITKDA